MYPIRHGWGVNGGSAGTLPLTEINSRTDTPPPPPPHTQPLLTIQRTGFTSGLAQHLQDLRLLLRGDRSTIIPIHNNRPTKILRALSKLLQGLILSTGTPDDRSDAFFADVLEDRLELVRGGGRLGDIEVEFGTLTMRVRLCCVVAGLVLGGGFRRVRVHLFEQCGGAHGAWGVGFVEEGYDVFCFVLLAGGGEEEGS